MTEKEQDIKNIKEVIADPSTPADVKAVMSEVLAKLEKEVGGSKPTPSANKPTERRAKPTERKVVFPGDKTEEEYLTHFELDGQSVYVPYFKKFLKSIFQISPFTAKRLINMKMFNEDKWGDMYIGKSLNDNKFRHIKFDTSEDGYDKPLFKAVDSGENIYIEPSVKVYNAWEKAQEQDPQMKFAKKIKEAIDTGKETAKKKPVPLPKDKQMVEGYDCDELVRKIKERKAKAKERAQLPKKSEATKNKNKIESVFDNVKDRADEKDITKAEIEKLIKETETILTLLKSKLSALK
jgi:hypothetical protein